MTIRDPVGGVFSCCLLLTYLCLTALAADSGSTSACADSLQHMTSCLDYVTGKQADPTSDCCSAVKDMRDKNVVCLCKFIQEVKSGSTEVKNLGIQESKLNDLPSACKMKSTNTSDCSLVLPSSAPTSSTVSNHSSSGCKRAELHLEVLMAAATVALLLRFPGRLVTAIRH